MKKLSKYLLFCLLLVGCVPVIHYSPQYDFTLKSVERPQNAKERYGESKIINIAEGDTIKYQFEDKMIDLTFIPTNKMFYLSLTNKTNHSIKLVWDEAVFVDSKGNSSKLANGEMRRISMNSPHPPSVIVRGSSFNTVVFPSANVTSNGIESVVPSGRKDSIVEVKSYAQNYIGQKVQILLPLMIEETVNEYIFSFEVNDFNIYKRTWDSFTGSISVDRVEE